MKCRLVEQGSVPGSCSTQSQDRYQKACDCTLKQMRGIWSRRIHSAHLSRPEHYFSIYQSGCNHSCLKCHSWEFSQCADGDWVSPAEVGSMAAAYAKKVTIWEPRERATMWHATELCRGCGSCLIYGKQGWLCPGQLKPDDLVFSPQGLGPARNIIAFTGGDVTCVPDFTCQSAVEIKKNCQNIWVLLESNGYGLTPSNLDRFNESGVDSFWLDIKAYDEEIYRKMCGATNEWVLKAPEEIIKRGFVLEVLTLYIPGWVEDDQIEKITRLIAKLDTSIPMTLLAFFPAFQMKDVKPPSIQDMIRLFHRMKEIGMKNIKLGNCGVFAKSEKDWETLLDAVDKKGIG